MSVERSRPPGLHAWRPIAPSRMLSLGLGQARFRPRFGRAPIRLTLPGTRGAAASDADRSTILPEIEV
jgi:hypothetical protein